jgi:hypothetical protein
MRTLMTTARIPMTLTHVHGQLSQAWRESVLDAMAAALQPALSTARACGGRILNALHDSRRRQAAIEIARHRHLL